MKKFLSLVLALVMTMSLVTVSAGAKDFTDNDKLNYTEAVAVMSDLKVLGGYTDGSFNPQGNLTRQAAAKIICNLILGPTTASALRADTAPFKDVAVNNDFAGYITYCAQQGIINGYADGTFRPTASLTGYAFMKMLLGALGYDGSIEGYTGPNWSVQVAKRALGIGLNAGLVDSFNGVKTVNREEAALYAFNTLKATMVEYDSRTTVSVGGSEVVIAGSAAKNVAQAGYKNTMGDKDTLQFAEKYFPKLTKEPAVDDFGRPAVTWANNKKDIGTYVDYSKMVAEYTVAVSGKEVYEDIGSTVVNNKNYTLNVWVDGEDDSAAAEAITKEDLKKTNKDDLAGTGNGVLTQVFVDVDTEEVSVVEVNTYLAKATADYNSKKETLSVEVYGDGASKIYLEDVASIEDVEAGEYMLVNIADGVIVNVMEPETVLDTAITKYSTDGTPSYVVMDGEQYDSAATLTLFDALLADYKQDALEDFTYDLYLDQYGYGIGIVKNSGEAKYVFITGYDKPTSNLSTSTATAAAIFTDGDMKEIKVAFKDSNKNIANDLSVKGESDRNQWFKYTEDDGVYTLDDVAHFVNVGYDTVKASLNVQNVRLINGTYRAYGNDDSVYITVDAEVDAADIDGATETGDAIVDVNGVYTGVQNMDLTVEKTDIYGTIKNRVWAVYDDDNYIIAAIVLGSDDSSSTGYAYAVKGAKSESFADGNYFWDFEAVVDGTVKTLTVKGHGAEYEATVDAIKSVIGVANVGKAGLLKLTYDAEGEYVTSATLMNDLDNKTDAIYSNGDYNDGDKDINPDDFVAYQVQFGAFKKLVASGRTLYSGGEGDVGLTIASGAPVVVLQEDADGNLSVEEYSTIKAALDALEDSDKFLGTVAAALNDRGTAEWLVLDSKTPLTDAGRPGDDDTNDDVVVTVNLLAKTVQVGITDRNLGYDDFAAFAMVELEDMGYEYADWNSTTHVLSVTNKNGGKVDLTVSYYYL